MVIPKQKRIIPLASSQKSLQSAHTMNTDRRVVPAHHVTSVLAEESISERTITMRETLGNSRIKLDQVAHKWSKNDGMNSLSRVIIMYIGKIPKKHHTPLPVTKIIHDEIPSVHHEIHDKKSTSKSTREEHVDH